jgi:hypothetical protein
VPWTELPADFGDAGWVELRTTGQVSWTINTATYAVNSWYCNGSNAWPYYGEGSVGGAGDASSNLRMTAVVSGAAPADDDYGALMVARGGGQVYRLSAAWPGARLYAKRSGLPGVCNGSPWYNFTGEHTVEVVKVTPVQVEPNKPEFLPGEVLTWTTMLYHGVTKLVWTFEGTNGEVGYPACSTSTCEYAPPGPGRMKVRGVWELAAPTVHVHDYSPLVTVQPPRLVLNCPASVQRGSNMTCSAMGQGGALSNVVWTFTPDGASQSIAGPTGTTSSWGGKMVIGGVMRVTAQVGTIAKDTTDTVTVTARPWAQLPLQVSNIGHDNLPVVPQSLADLANTDILAPASMGVQVIPDGPNAGWWYLPSALSAVPVVHRWSNAWQPSDPWYQGFTGGAHPSGNGNWCGPLDMPGIDQSAREHEGIVAGQLPSHLSVLRDFFARFPLTADVDSTSPQAKLERFKAYGLSAAQADSAANQTFAGWVRHPALTDPRQRHYNPLTQQPGNTGMVPLAVLPCHLF